MGLEYIRPMRWEEAFAIWEGEEANMPHWIEHYQKRGFNSWQEWRRDSFKDLHPDQLTWALYKIPDPKMVLEFHGGPFRVWINKYYGDKKTPQFKELVQNTEFKNDPKKQEIIQKFPKESILIGLINKGDITIIDGMHRCCALAIAHEKGIHIDTNLYIILAEFNEEIPIMGQPNSLA